MPPSSRTAQKKTPASEMEKRNRPAYYEYNSGYYRATVIFILSCSSKDFRGLNVFDRGTCLYLSPCLSLFLLPLSFVSLCCALRLSALLRIQGRVSRACCKGFLQVEFFSPPFLTCPSHVRSFYLVVGWFFHNLLQIRHLHWQLVDHTCKATPV